MSKRVFVTGTAWSKGELSATGNECTLINKEQYENEISGVKVRGADRISKICISTAQRALSDAGLMGDGRLEAWGLFLGSMYGPLNSVHEFDSVSVDKGALFVNPGHFPNTVLNSPACQTSIQFGISGPLFTLCNGAVSALDAVGLGYCHVANSICPSALAGGVDEYSELQKSIHKPYKPLYEACGFWVLESEPEETRGKNVEIMGYDTFQMGGSDLCMLSDELMRRISIFLNNIDRGQFQFKELSIYGSLPEHDLEQIADKVSTSCGVNRNKIPNSLDFMGTGPIFQILDMERENECCFKENKRASSDVGGKLNIIAGIDGEKVSTLFLGVK